MSNHHQKDGLLRRHFLGQTAGLALLGMSSARLDAQPPSATAGGEPDLVIVNGRIHTMDPANRVVTQALIQNGRFTAVGNRLSVPRGNVRRVDAYGRRP